MAIIVNILSYAKTNLQPKILKSAFDY